jgi:hypothetical protein
MFRRRGGRPSLIGTAARTAVIAGTATATINAVGGGSRQAQPQPQAAPQASPQPAAHALTEETIAKLKQLGELHASGVLTEQEFAQAKAKLLG